MKTVNITPNSKKVDAKLIKLENGIRLAAKSFIVIGKNLTEICDTKLYLERGFNSFEVYMSQMFDYSRDYGIKIRKAYAIYALLEDEKFKTLPINEGQVRPLTKFDIDTPAGIAQVKSVWKLCIEAEQRITAAMVQAGVNKILNPNMTEDDSKPGAKSDTKADTKQSDMPFVPDKPSVNQDVNPADEVKLLKAKQVEMEADLIKAKAAIKYTVPRTKLAIELYKAGYKALLSSCTDDQKAELTELYNKLVGLS